MGKVTLSLLFLLLLLEPSAALAQQPADRHRQHRAVSGDRAGTGQLAFDVKGRSSSRLAAKTVMMDSDCDKLSLREEASAQIGASSTCKGSDLRIESKTPAKAILKGSWDVKFSCISVEVYNALNSETKHRVRETLSRQFSEESLTVLNLEDDSFKSNRWSSSESENKKFWCINSSFSDFDSHSVRSDRHLWMGINPSYFDGLYKIHLTKSGSPSYQAEIKYYLRGTRRHLL